MVKEGSTYYFILHSSGVFAVNAKHVISSRAFKITSPKPKRIVSFQEFLGDLDAEIARLTVKNKTLFWPETWFREFDL